MKKIPLFNGKKLYNNIIDRNNNEFLKVKNHKLVMYLRISLGLGFMHKMNMFKVLIVKNNVIIIDLTK